MKNALGLSFFLSVFLVTSCGAGAEFIEKGKKAKCKLETLNQQLASDPDNESIKSEIKQNTDWIEFYRKESGDATKFDKILNEHTCK